MLDEAFDRLADGFESALFSAAVAESLEASLLEDSAAPVRDARAELDSLPPALRDGQDHLEGDLDERQLRQPLGQELQTELHVELLVLVSAQHFEAALELECLELLAETCCFLSVLVVPVRLQLDLSQAVLDVESVSGHDDRLGDLREHDRYFVERHLPQRLALPQEVRRCQTPLFFLLVEHFALLLEQLPLVCGLDDFLLRDRVLRVKSEKSRLTKCWFALRICSDWSWTRLDGFCRMTMSSLSADLESTLRVERLGPERQELSLHYAVEQLELLVRLLSLLELCGQQREVASFESLVFCGSVLAAELGERFVLLGPVAPERQAAGESRSSAVLVASLGHLRFFVDGFESCEEPLDELRAVVLLAEADVLFLDDAQLVLLAPLDVAVSDGCFFSLLLVLRERVCQVLLLGDDSLPACEADPEEDLRFVLFDPQDDVLVERSQAFDLPQTRFLADSLESCDEGSSLRFVECGSVPLLEVLGDPRLPT